MADPVSTPRPATQVGTGNLSRVRAFARRAHCHVEPPAIGCCDGHWERGSIVNARRRAAFGAVCCAVLLLMGGGLQVSASARSDAHQAWRMIWSDNFAGTSLNAHKWNTEHVASPRNNELEFYIPRNVAVGGGHLSLISRHESYQGQSYTSAAVDTYQKFSFTYGKVVIRARLPVMGAGIWPALWMLGTGCNPVGPPCPWPADGANEIDNLEAVNTPSTMYMTPHWGDVPGHDLASGGCTFSGADFSAGYHTFGMIWKPGGVIEWYVDGRQRCVRSAPGHFTDPMYLIFNTAIGGSWPGPPDSATPFPQRFDIDYVRVYQHGNANGE